MAYDRVGRRRIRWDLLWFLALVANWAIRFAFGAVRVQVEMKPACL